MSFDDIDPTNFGGGDLEAVVDGTNGSSIQTLIAPIQKLTLEEGSLMTFGSTSVFRFRPVVLNNVPSRFPAIMENPKDTYVLLVEGVDRSCYNPNFDWARYLPSVVPLDRMQHDKALDLTFKFATSWCLRIIPGLFCRDMYRALSVPRSQPPPKTAHYSPMLHNALVALALSLLDEPAFRDLKTRKYFADEAKKYIDSECSQPNLCTVSALSTLGTFHSSQGEQTLGFMYFGMAARISQALGLDVDCSEWVKLHLIEETDVLDRYWTFWTIFAQDVNWSLYVGRDFCVRAPTESDFKDMPVPFVDTEFDKLPFHHPPSNIPPQPGYLSKVFASTCELLVIARRIMNVVNGISRTRVQATVIDEMISDIDLQLNAWKDSLPPEADLTQKSRTTATPHKLMMHLSYWWFFILLHRPYFHRKPRVIHSSDKEIDHVKLCKRAAENIMDLLGIWKQLYGLRYTPVNIIQPLFAAGTIYLLSGIQATSGVRVANKELKHSIDSLETCISHLREMSKSWQCASSIRSILRSLFEDKLKPAMDKKKPSIGPTKAHLRTNSEGDRIYITNPPSRRHSTVRKSRSRQTTGSTLPRSDGGDSQPVIGSPTISVHPALDDTQYARDQSQSTFNLQQSSNTASQDLLTPWSAQTGSPGSQPIPINRHRSGSHSGSSSSGSPVSVKMPASPHLHNGRSISISPSSPSGSYIRDPSPTGSFHGGSPIQNMAGGFSNSVDLGMMGLDMGEGQGQYDYANFEMSRYLAMLGGQHLSDVPFVGPINITFGEPIGSLEQQTPAMDFDMDFGNFSSQQQSGGSGREPLTGDSPGSSGLPGYYPPMQSAPPTTASFGRRATSENFRPSHGMNGLDVFSEFDFTQGFR
ncbi:nucleus protein [Coprinopsis cinerea AmutBmut pab1-1]|nr:nucleus protein [Coprinopsis cinerea AmutBmut pab1-1]